MRSKNSHTSASMGMLHNDTKGLDKGYTHPQWYKGREGRALATHGSTNLVQVYAILVLRFGVYTLDDVHEQEATRLVRMRRGAKAFLPCTGEIVHRKKGAVGLLVRASQGILATTYVIQCVWSSKGAQHSLTGYVYLGFCI